MQQYHIPYIPAWYILHHNGYLQSLLLTDFLQAKWWWQLLSVDMFANVRVTVDDLIDCEGGAREDMVVFPWVAGAFNWKEEVKARRPLPKLKVQIIKLVNLLWHLPISDVQACFDWLEEISLSSSSHPCHCCLEAFDLPWIRGDLTLVHCWNCKRLIV